MAQAVTQQQKAEVRDHFSQMRNNLDRMIEDNKNIGNKLGSTNEVVSLGFETIQKSLEHNRAIVNQNEKSWETETAGR